MILGPGGGVYRLKIKHNNEKYQRDERKIYIEVPPPTHTHVNTVLSGMSCWTSNFLLFRARKNVVHIYLEKGTIRADTFSIVWESCSDCYEGSDDHFSPFAKLKNFSQTPIPHDI